MRYRLSALAELDLADIWDYLATHSSVHRADQVLDTIEDAFELLSAHPSVGRQRPELGQRVRSFPAAGYVIYYEPADIVVVARVLHGRRDQAAALRPSAE